MQLEESTFSISSSKDITILQTKSKSLAKKIGFDENGIEEIALAISELASNLIKHANGGEIKLISLINDAKKGIQIESLDEGPGIADVDLAMTDGFSTKGSLGYGLGTINRMMNEIKIISRQIQCKGTHIVCTRWIDKKTLKKKNVLDVGGASRAHPKMVKNGDAFIIKRWKNKVLVGIIDGLGHGEHAYQASNTALQYVEKYFDQPLLQIILGVEKDCRNTRGVVMALVLFNWEESKLTFASVGNIITRVIGGPKSFGLVVRRGILGRNAQKPIIIERPWEKNYILVMHSDGVSTHWHWDDFSHLINNSARLIAFSILEKLANANDDATVVVVKEFVPNIKISS